MPSAEEIQHQRLQLRRVVVPIAVNLPRDSAQRTAALPCPCVNRAVRLGQAVIGADMSGDGCFAARSTYRSDLAGCGEVARDLDAEVDVHRIAVAGGMVIQEDVVSIGPQAGLRAQKCPD